ncbi:MAG: hypothetical protein VB062_04680 [Christensenella sp.]|nr:hypothetical protein [Christensenella sp.]
MSEQEAIKIIQDHMRVHRIGEYPHIKLGEALVKAIDALNSADEAERDIELLAGEDTSGEKCNICAHNPNDKGCELDGSQFDDDGECHFKWRRTKWATTALRAQQERENPLTLDELLGMDDKPVYVQKGSGEHGWAIVVIDHYANGAHSLYLISDELTSDGMNEPFEPDEDFINMEYNDPAGHFGLRVLGWRAYATEPKEVSPKMWGEPKGDHHE